MKSKAQQVQDALTKVHFRILEPNPDGTWNTACGLTNWRFPEGGERWAHAPDRDLCRECQVKLFGSKLPRTSGKVVR
jgi:hypothetical protein